MFLPQFLILQFSSVQSLSHVWLFATPWTTTCQASLFITNFQSLLKLMSIESVMPSNHPTVSSSVVPFSTCLQSFTASGSFPMSQLLEPGDQSIGASASASVLPVNIQGWFPLGLAGLSSLQSKGLSVVISSTINQRHQFFGAQPFLSSNSYIRTWLQEKLCYRSHLREPLFS